MTLLELLWTFFYIGLFTIGGGQVAITLMYEPLVGGGIISGEQFYNMVAVSESSPGPIGINMATYIGCELYGVMGGILVTFATVLPSLIIILVIAKFFDKYQEKPLVKSVFTCIRPVSAGLIAVAAYEVLKISVIQVFSIQRLLIFLVALVLLLRKKTSIIFVMILGAIAGILFL
jgi:chromate transporter